MNGGATLSLSGEVLKEGYCVALPRELGFEKIKGHSSISDTFAFVDNFISSVPNSMGNKAIGAWVNTENNCLYLDLVDVVHNKEAAIRLGKARKQIAIFNLDTLEEIRL